MSGSHKDLNVEPLIEKYGIEPYGLYWLLCELVADYGTDYRLKKEKNWMVIARNRSRLPQERFNSYCEELSVLDLIDKKAYQIEDLYIPKMEKYSDDYTKKVRRVSEQDTDNVAQSRLHNITLHKNTLHNNIQPSSLKSLTQDELKELATKFSVSVSCVNGRIDDLIDYCAASGKKYKDYVAALRNFLKSHIQKHPDCIVVKKDPPKIEPTFKRSPEEQARIREKITEMKKGIKKMPLN